MTAGARMNAASDRQAAAAKMRAEFAKRAEAIREKAEEDGKITDTEEAVKAHRAEFAKRLDAMRKETEKRMKTIEREKVEKARRAASEKREAEAAKKKGPSRESQGKEVGILSVHTTRHRRISKAYARGVNTHPSGGLFLDSDCER